MPGLIGFVGDSEDDALLAKMGQALEPEPLFKRDLYQAQAWGLGRVHLAVLNPQPQPVWNEDRSRCLVLEGELYNAPSLRQGLTDQGAPLPAGDAALILHLYEQEGAAFIHRLQGAFTVAIWDQQTRQLLLANDRLGLYPTYYAQANGRFLFASGVRALLADPHLTRTVNRVGMAQFLTFDHLLGDQTLLQEVSLLRGSSLLTWQDGRFHIDTYWEPTHPQQYQLYSEETWMESLLYQLKQAVRRQAPGDLPAGMLLSGGMDSRVLAILLRDVGGAGKRPLPTFTWGIPGCDDARAAREVANYVGFPNQFDELKPDWLLAVAEEAVRATDGLGNVVNLHARANLEQQVPHAQLFYKGFMGDAMFGFALRHQHWADYDTPTSTEAHLSVHRDQGVITFEPAEQPNLFTAEMGRQVGTAVLDSYRAGMDEAGSTQLADQRIYFDYRQRVPRMTINGVEVVRSRAAVRLPFCDYELMDLALTIPPGLRYRRRLMRDTFIRYFPEMAQIPLPDTGLPMISCARDIRLRSEDWLRWHLSERVSWIKRNRKRPYKDYNAWFRTILRPWVEETLLNPHSLERGYFQPQYVRQLVQDHMAGHNHTIRLGALLSLELWHRQFID
jgi:asparagine synthase (glutamine-hydrolysing)